MNSPLMAAGGTSDRAPLSTLMWPLTGQQTSLLQAATPSEHMVVEGKHKQVSLSST